MRLLLCAVLGLSSIVCAAPLALGGLTVNGYSPATADRYDRFNNSAAFLGNPYDWSGVGRTSTGKWGTLISPSFVISARHFAPDAGSTIRFYSSNDPGGTFVERTIGTSIPLTQMGFAGPSDLVLTPLSAPVAGVKSYAIVAPTSPSNLIGQELYVWGQADMLPIEANMRLGRNEIFDVLPAVDDGTSRGSVFVYDYNTTSGVGADEARLVTNDSGGPSFLLGSDGPALIGVHWFNTEPADGLTGPRQGSGDTLVSSFVNELNAAMASTGSAERVRVVAVPEPSSLAVLVFAVGATLVRRRSEGI